MKLNSILTFLSCAIIVVSGQSNLGGSDAPDGKYPYQAALYNHAKYLCGASIISSRWILTAAHCVTHIKSPADAMIMVGTNKAHGKGGTAYKVSQLVMHEDYNKIHVHANDIGLVRVAKDIKFTKKVKSIGLPDKRSKNYENVTAIFAGWGTVTDRHRAADNLQHVKLTVINHGRCVAEWRDNKNREILESQICTIGKIAENMATQGDSGGPLVSDGVQIGIGSFAWQDLPDVFTNVQNYLPWIYQHINK